jgi:Peptidase M15
MSQTYRICRLCSSYLNAHPDNLEWLKCPSCGFSKVLTPVITLEQYFMGRDKLYPQELTQEIIDNATILLEKVNAILVSLKVKKAEVSSGWRPAAINSQTKNAAKKSLHMVGKAIDIKDDASQTLANKVVSNPELLKNLGLWLEDPASTKGKNTNWVHLDIGTRSDRPLRIFKP